ncbi:MAG TPA: hypothetical protein VM783_17580 [Candidatus Acidoferrum sp.]|nr:hypothetical protein [Candidatus Acidoferrum sp.]
MTKTPYQAVRIVAAVVDTQRLTLYMPDGTTVFVQQGDPNLRRIVEQATPQLLKQGWADVQLNPPVENSYAQFEQQSGVVRFFRIAKAKLKALMVEPEPPDTSPVTEMSIGKIPVKPQQTDRKDSGFFTPTIVGTEAVAESLGLEDQAKVSGIPEHLISGAAEAIEQFGEDELERYRDEQEANKKNCAAGIHSWIDSIVTLSPDTKCTFCGEPYGDPDTSLEDMSGVYAKAPSQESTVEPLDEAAVVAALNQAEEDADLKRTEDAVNEILAHALPVSDPQFHEHTVGKQGAIVNDDNGKTSDYLEEPDAPDTIIAVVDNKIIPGMEKIKAQFARAAKMGSTAGVEKFLQRIGAVMDKRAHSIDELLTFMERGDLPIAEDGSILIYKVLNHHGGGEQKTFVDCHSGQVKQWVGAYVCMDENLVDMNRRQECSVGLHVARRGYVRGFSGNACVLGKLAPEDVIAVPHGEANKLRACGYHIIKELTPKQHNLLKANRPITDDPDGKILLADAIAGRHIGITHRVEITGPKGGGVKVTKLVQETPEVEAKAAAEVVPVDALPNINKPELDEPVSPVGVAKEVTKVVEQQQLSRKEQATKLYEEWKACIDLDDRAAAHNLLVAFKKASKVSWDKLGITDPVFTGGVGSVFYTKPKPPVASPFGTKPKTKAAKVASPTKTKEKKMETAVAEEVKTAQAFTSVEEILNAKNTPATKIQQLRALGLEAPGVAAAILKVKKEAKKSWEYFGMNGDDYAKLLELSLKN